MNGMSVFLEVGNKGKVKFLPRDGITTRSRSRRITRSSYPNPKGENVTETRQTYPVAAGGLGCTPSPRPTTDLVTRLTPRTLGPERREALPLTAARRLSCGPTTTDTCMRGSR